MSLVSDEILLEYKRVLAHDRRRIVHFNVARHPTAEWTGQQLREAFPFDQLPRYLLRDRDAIFGQDFREQVQNMGIKEVLSTPRSPWQRAYVERMIGSIRRECLDHVIVFDAGSLRRTLASYFDYYHRSRTHLSLGKDSLAPRPIQQPEIGPVVAVRQVGGLHHRYERQAARVCEFVHKPYEVAGSNSSPLTVFMGERYCRRATQSFR